MERCLSHVVEQAIEKLLGVALLTNHEVLLATADLVEKLDADRPHLMDACVSLFEDSLDVRLEHAERAEFVRVSHRLMNDLGALVLLAETVAALAVGVDNKVEIRQVAEALLAVTGLAAVFHQDLNVAQALQHAVGEASVAHVDVARQSVQLSKLLLTGCR